MLAQVHQQLDDALALVLGARGPVAEAGGRLRAVTEKQVREARGGDAKVGAHALGPLVPDRDVVAAADVDAGEPAGHRVEAGAEGDHVEFVLAVAGEHAARRDALDGTRLQVHQADVRLVEDVEEPLLERGPLDRVGMRRLGRREDVGDGRILDARAHLAPPEVIGGAIGGFVGEDVLVGAEPEMEAAGVPQAFVGGFPLRGGHRQRRLRDEAEVEAAEAFAAPLEGRGIVRLHRLVVGLAQLALAHRQVHVGRALEHGQVRGHLRRLLRDLDAARPGADHADALAGEVDALLRPQRRVVRFAREVFEARQRRDVGLGGEARADDHEARPQRAALRGLEQPLARGFVEARTVHAGPEADVTAQVEFRVDIIEVAPHFLPAGEALAPIPVPPQVLARELVDLAMRVDARARIAVPVPDTAEARAGVDEVHPEAELAQTEQLVDTGEAGADDDDVESGGRVCGGRGCGHEVSLGRAVGWLVVGACTGTCRRRNAEGVTRELR